MDKLLHFSGKSEKGIFTYVVDNELPYLLKTAAEFHPEIAAYMRNAKKIPGKTQILLTALGAGEYWGDNNNGDFFTEEGLVNSTPEYGHKTFETNAKIYKNHVNKDPNKSYGDVALAVYNIIYHRVELIVILDDAKAPDIAEEIANGIYPEWSMGCRIPWDECSICGNRAKTIKEYCEHLRYRMGQIDQVTKKKIYAINRTPKFFDISKVLIGADKTAKTLKKVASFAQKIEITPSAVLAEKQAEINKVVPTDGPPASQDSIDTLMHSIPEVKAQEKPMSTDMMDRLGRFNLSDVMSTLSFLGILPKPQEFQRILLISIGKKNIADQLDQHNMCFEPTDECSDQHKNMLDISPHRFNPNILDLVKNIVPDRSYMAPHLGRRIIIMSKTAGAPEYIPNFIKTSERKPIGIIPVMALAAGLYAALGSKSGDAIAGGLEGLIRKHPALAAALAISVPLIFNNVFGSKNIGQFDAGKMQSSDTINLADRINEMRQKPFNKTATLMGPASKRLFLGIPAVYMASGLLQKHKQSNPYEEEGKIKSFIRKYPDLISAGLAADAIAGAKGTHGILEHGLPKVDRMFRKTLSAFGKVAEEHPLLKSASAHDFISNSLIWPLAAGGANLPAKIVGGLFDQAVIETSKKVLSNRKQEGKINNVPKRS